MRYRIGNRLLLIADRQGFHERFATLFPQSSCDVESAPAGVAEGTWSGAADLAAGLRLDSAHGGQEALERVRQAVRRGQPYALAAVDFRVPYCEGLALVDQLWAADPSLVVLGCVAGDDAWTHIASRLEFPQRLVFLGDSLGAIEVRHLVAVELHRRVLGEELSRLGRELESARGMLARARAEVEESRRAKMEWMANVTHELRTPMNVILGFAGLLLKEPMEPDQKEKVRRVHEAGGTLLRMIEDMLDFSQVSEGKLGLQPAPFCLEAATREVLGAVQPIADRKGLLLSWHIEAAIPPWIWGDGARFHQILVHLIDNALKFTEAGSVHVQTALEEADPAKIAIRTVVTDTGVGIPPDRQGIIFESFAQADGSTTRRFGGIGLGLTLSKQLVDLMGGQIGFRSTPGEGSSFWVVLPFERCLPTVPEPETFGAAGPGACRPTAPASRGSLAATSAALQPPVQPPPARRKKRRVLVADEDRLARTSIELLLSRAGCVVDVACSVEEAIAVLQCSSYDLIVLNRESARGDALEALRAVRRQSAQSDCRARILCTTADLAPARRQECLDAGADETLAKPFDPETLLEAVQGQLPGLLESDPQASPEPQTSTPTDMLELLEERLRELRGALGQPDFHDLENRARELKELAARAGSDAVADHAMRVQLAARRHDLQRATTAIERLDRTLRQRPVFRPRLTPSTCGN